MTSNPVELEEEEVVEPEEEIDPPTEGALREVEGNISQLRLAPSPCSTCG